MRMAFPGITLDEIEDMEYVDWVHYRDLAAAWQHSRLGGA